ncbi:DUF4386 family protein [Chryseoglobus sp. 28M-23]|uniref:DUF4386 family protein n=1 Tax=Chryseoglobus sp. 28M-23 TaxID=2772253 RepID=UPI001745EA90|nr:DUF4386 family protein [Chryseoglobus sp. 28M-23]QOD93703.1 DUF4386 family protein [Chryseoglobus sp. 28M-23]
MNTMQKVGGVAASTAAGTFVFGILLALTRLRDYVTTTDPAVAVPLLVEHEPMLILWNTVITIVFGIVMVPLAIALGDRVPRERAGQLARVGLAFGLLWAGVIIAAGMVIGVGLSTVSSLASTDAQGAQQLWRAVDTVGNGLGGGNEVIGAVWVIVASLAAWIGRALPRWICAIGILAGIPGLLTLVPGFADAGAAFGVAMIVWFSLVGIALWYLRPAHERALSTAPPATASA